MTECNIYSHVIVNKMTKTHENIMYYGALEQYKL